LPIAALLVDGSGLIFSTEAVTFSFLNLIIEIAALPELNHG
jgi:hypothetical protein